MQPRCQWAQREPMIGYHDLEWGTPLHDERALFEFLILEGAQAGLSWETILKKRDNYRAAFNNFDPARVAAYDEAKVAALLANAGIVRNRLKISAAIQNARAFMAVQQAFGSFDAYVWGFVDGQPIQNAWNSLAEVPVSTPEAQALSRDLLKRGFKFVGPTICYAFMQATGMVNDHTVDCFRHSQLRAAQEATAEMKRVLLPLGLACLAIALALIAAGRLPQAALPVVIGVIAGVAASLPTSLLIVWRVTRAGARPVVMPAPPERPPTVIVMPAEPAGTSGARPAPPTAPRPPAPALDTRRFTIIGGHDDGDA